MARIRTVKPEFWTDEKVVQLPFQARLLFIGMLNFADDEGYLADEPGRIQMQVFPGDDVDVEATLDLLAAVGLVTALDLSDGSRALQITNFGKHQKVSHKTPTRLPVKGAKKRAVPAQARRAVATKYGCLPGEEKSAACYYCGTPGMIYWARTTKGRPSSWVCFSGLEIDHFVPENSGGGSDDENLVLSCRYCNRSKGTRPARDLFSGKLPNTPPKTGEPFREPSALKGREGKGIESSPLPPTPAPEASPNPEPAKPALATEAVALGQAVLGILNRDPSSVMHFGQVHAWLESGFKPEEIRAVAALVSPRLGADIRDPLKYLGRFMGDEIAKLRAGGGAPPADGGVVVNAERGRHEQWRARCKAFFDKGMWLPHMGPKPGEPGCEVPPEVLAEFDLEIPGFLKRTA